MEPYYYNPSMLGKRDGEATIYTVFGSRTINGKFRIRHLPKRFESQGAAQEYADYLNKRTQHSLQTDPPSALPGGSATPKTAGS